MIGQGMRGVVNPVVGICRDLFCLYYGVEKVEPEDGSRWTSRNT
jgi:hypothetical protein